MSHLIDDVAPQPSSPDDAHLDGSFSSARPLPPAERLVLQRYLQVGRWSSSGRDDRPRPAAEAGPAVTGR